MKYSRSEAERIRHREVSRTLRKMSLSPEKEQEIERMSRSLVEKILTGPLSERTALVACADPYSGCTRFPGDPGDAREVDATPLRRQE